MRKLDMPIGRLKFFTNSIIIFALQVIAIAIYYIFYFLLKSPNALLTLVVIFSIVFGIPILYLHFINYAKRIWDIAGNFNLAIWLTIVLFAISFICLFFFPIAIIIFYLGMIFISGKYSTK